MSSKDDLLAQSIKLLIQRQLHAFRGGLITLLKECAAMAILMYRGHRGKLLGREHEQIVVRCIPCSIRFVFLGNTLVGHGVHQLFLKESLGRAQLFWGEVGERGLTLGSIGSSLSLNGIS
jgi:hypothetical protein